MQPKYTHNKSNIIKVTEEAKKKSRQRLIGSIVLLFIALVVLLNVTAKVKPIPINPEVVEIKNSAASAPVATQNINSSSAIVAAKPLTPPLGASTPIASGVIIATPNKPPASPATVVKTITATTSSNTNTTNNQGFKAGVVTKENNGNNATKQTALPLQGEMVKPQQTDEEVITAPTPKPKPKAKPKPVNPADILDGLIDNGSTEAAQPSATKETVQKSTKSYIQFAALSSQEKADKLQEVLSSHGIHATVKPIQTEKGTLYRLRAGPFDKEEAQAKLKQITAEGYSGIVTGK